MPFNVRGREGGELSQWVGMIYEAVLGNVHVFEEVESMCYLFALAVASYFLLYNDVPVFLPQVSSYIDSHACHI